VLLHAQDHVIIPHWMKARTTIKSNKEVDSTRDDTKIEEEEEGKIVVSLMTDDADPFCPLPLEEWTYAVSSKSQ